MVAEETREKPYLSCDGTYPRTPSHSISITTTKDESYFAVRQEERRKDTEFDFRVLHEKFRIVELPGCL